MGEQGRVGAPVIRDRDGFNLVGIILVVAPHSPACFRQFYEVATKEALMRRARAPAARNRKGGNELRPASRDIHIPGT